MRLRMLLKSADTDLAETTGFGQAVKQFLPYSVTLTFVTDGPQSASLEEIRDWLGAHIFKRSVVDLIDVPEPAAIDPNYADSAK